ncbi:hypothetical protein HZC34_06615 [Candidatus Saganbacteria bacterium]|nr:hypothetical protein [Candidatus Saganbacteria bacterium]
MAEMKPEGIRAVYRRIIKSLGKVKTDHDLELIDKTNDSGSGADKSFVYAKVDKGTVVIANSSDEAAKKDKTFTKIDLSDGLSRDELVALGIKPEEIEILGIIGRGWKLKGEKDAQADTDPKSQIIEDSEVAMFDNACREYADAYGWSKFEAQNAYLYPPKDPKDPGFVRQDLETLAKNRKSAEAALFEKIKLVKTKDELLKAIKTELSLDDSSPIIRNINHYFDSAQSDISKDDNKKEILTYILKLASGSQWNNNFQLIQLRIRIPIETKYTGDMSLASLKAWAPTAKEFSTAPMPAPTPASPTGTTGSTGATDKRTEAIAKAKELATKGDYAGARKALDGYVADEEGKKIDEALQRVVNAEEYVKTKDYENARDIYKNYLQGIPYLPKAIDRLDELEKLFQRQRPVLLDARAKLEQCSTLSSEIRELLRLQPDGWIVSGKAKGENIIKIIDPLRSVDIGEISGGVESMDKLANFNLSLVSAIDYYEKGKYDTALKLLGPLKRPDYYKSFYLAKCHEKLAEAERSKKDRDKFVEIGHLRSALSSYTEAAQRNGLL